LISEVVLSGTDIHSDERGMFAEMYRSEDGEPIFSQCNVSISEPGVLRGLHGIFDRPQGKLVVCIEGEVLDVAVDLRPGSRTFGYHIAETLCPERMNKIYVPPGFAHGFCVVGNEPATVIYMCTTNWNNDGFSVAWDDLDLAISWPVSDPVLSEKDQRGISLAEYIRLVSNPSRARTLSRVRARPAPRKKDPRP